jgi:hypothetical protein
MKRRLLILAAIVCALNTISLFTLNAWIMATLNGVAGGAFYNLSRESPFPYLRKMMVGLTVVGMLLAAPMTLNSLTSGIRHLGDHVVSNGPQSISYASRFGLWWSAVWMSLGGLAYGAPYTVAEQVLMFWPGPKERLWNDDFPSHARKVRDQIEDAKRKAGGGSGVYTNDLIWRSYCQDDCDVGLALNGGDLTVEIADDGEKCTATARVSVWYKPQYRSSTILGYGGYALRIDQAAYWALQELGWLHPFTLRYRWEC